uniref:DUF5741 domain-containing protein n=1 Tax=Mesocestoides corti TaxID=53468 RepID=A0A5K3FWC5_MESCO
MRDAEAKNAALLEVAESRLAAAEERRERLVAREVELLDEMEAKDVKILVLENNLQAVLMTAAETQVELESLSRRMVELEEAAEGRNSRRSSASDMEEKARKYSELKAVAFKLKSRLHKRTELLESSMKENRHLRRIAHENERRAKGFLEELERLRRQIVKKNAVIKKLMAVVRSLPVRHFGARPCEDAPHETHKPPRRARSVESSCKGSGHEVAPDVGEECVGVAVATAEPCTTSDLSSSDAEWYKRAHFIELRSLEEF